MWMKAVAASDLDHDRSKIDGSASDHLAVVRKPEAGASERDLSENGWSEADVRRLLEREDFRYQKIELPFGHSTGGYDRSPTAAKIFPSDMSGKTLLDLGCSLGYFCFEALRRGADRVVGVDMDPDNIRKAKALASCLGLDAEFRCLDIEEEPIAETFDYVICLNLLHHLRNPISALDQFVACTRERLILEIATVGLHDRRKLGISWFAKQWVQNIPVVFVTRGGTRGKREVQKFYITLPAVENLLMYQRGNFARLETSRSQHKNRFISIAYKRKIGHLLVVSGPTSAGKKSFIRKFLNNELPQLSEQLGTPDAAVWSPRVNASRLWEEADPLRDRFLLHDDFLRPYLRSTRTHERDEAFDLLDCADRVSFITIWTPPDRLVQQITAAEIEPKMKKRWSRKKSSRCHLKIREEYKNPRRVIEHYREWFSFTEKKSKEHFVISSRDLQIRSIPQWEGEIATRVWDEAPEPGPR